MAIKQEKRPFAPRPEVHDTDYGAKFIKAATETAAGEVALEIVTEEPAKEEPVVQEQPAEVVNEAPQKPEPGRKGKGGRPKKK